MGWMAFCTEKKEHDQMPWDIKDELRHSMQWGCGLGGWALWGYKSLLESGVQNKEMAGTGTGKDTVAEGRQGWRQTLILGFSQVLIHCDQGEGHNYLLIQSESCIFLISVTTFPKLPLFKVSSRPVQQTAIEYPLWLLNTKHPKTYWLKEHLHICSQFCHLGSF